MLSNFGKEGFSEKGVDYIKKSFPSKVFFGKTMPVNFEIKAVNEDMSSFFMCLYETPAYHIVAATQNNVFKLKLRIKKEEVIEQMLQIYSDRVENFTKENLEKLRMMDLLFLQANLDLARSWSRDSKREEGNLIENINYFLSSEERSEDFPILLDTQYLVAENKRFKGLKQKPFLKELIEEAEGLILKSFRDEDRSALLNYTYFILGMSPRGQLFLSSGFYYLGGELPKLRYLNVNGVKVKINSPRKYERKYLEELVVYLQMYSLKIISNDIFDGGLLKLL